MQKKLFVLGFMMIASTFVACAMEDDIDNGNWAKKIALWRAQAAQERKQREAERYASWGYSGFSDLLTISKFGEITTMGEVDRLDGSWGKTE